MGEHGKLILDENDRWVIGYDPGHGDRACAVRQEQERCGVWVVTDVWYDDEIPEWILNAKG